MKDIPGIDFKPQDIPSIKKIKIYNLNQHLDDSILTAYNNEIKSARERLFAAIGRTISYLARAKAEHDLLETYYVPVMNFEAVNAKREEILARVLKYAETSGE